MPQQRRPAQRPHLPDCQEQLGDNTAAHREATPAGTARKRRYAFAFTSPGADHMAACPVAATSAPVPCFVPRFGTCFEVPRAEAVPDLSDFIGKRLFLTLSLNRMVEGVLRGFDDFKDIVLDNAVEIISPTETNKIGVVVIRGFSVVRWDASHWRDAPPLSLSEKPRTATVEAASPTAPSSSAQSRSLDATAWRDAPPLSLGEKPRTATGTASSSSAQISSLDAVASLSLGRLLPIGQKPRKVMVDAATQTAPSSSSSAQSMSLDKVEPGKKKRKKKKSEAKRKKDLLAKNRKRCQKRREERVMKKAQA